MDNKIEMIKLNNLKADSGHFTTKPKKRRVRVKKVKKAIKEYNYYKSEDKIENKIEDKVENKVENKIEDKVEDEINKECNVGSPKETMLGLLIGIPLSLTMMYIFGYFYINYILTL